MSYFNSEQRDYMKSLDLMPTETRCWCGWYRVGYCPNCKTDKTCADKLKERCPECWNDGGPEGRQIVHRKGCKVSTENQNAH